MLSNIVEYLLGGFSAIVTVIAMILSVKHGEQKGKNKLLKAEIDFVKHNARVLESQRDAAREESELLNRIDHDLTALREKQLEARNANTASTVDRDALNNNY